MVDLVNTIYVKSEATYLTEAAIARADVRLSMGATMDGLKGETASRDLDRYAGGNSPAGFGNERRAFSYPLELVGSGAAGTAPVWMEDLRFCGMTAPVLAAGVSATSKFALTNAAISSCTAHFYSGAQRRRAIGARGDFSIMIEGGSVKKAKVMFDMIGFPPGTMMPDEIALAGVEDYARFATKPLAPSPENTSMMLGNYAVALRSFKLDAKVPVEPRFLAGSKYIFLGTPAPTVEIMIERPSVLLKNYYSNLKGEDEIPMNLIHGLVAGNIVEVNSTTLQILDVEDAFENGVPMLKISAQLNGVFGNGDLTLIAR